MIDAGLAPERAELIRGVIIEKVSNVPERCIEAYSEPDGKSYRVVKRVAGSGMVESVALPGLRVMVRSVFADMPAV